MRFGLILSLMLLCSCGNRYQLRDFPLYQKVQIDRVSNSEDRSTKASIDGLERVNVVVGQFDAISESSEKLHAFPTVTAARLVQGLARKSYINLIDRKLAAKIKNEIQIAEMQGKTAQSSNLLGAADYAIVGTITRGEFSSRYSTVSQTFTQLATAMMLAQHSGVNVMVDAGPERGSYRYEANVEGIIRILALPSVREIKRINFAGTAGAKESGNADSGKQTDQRLIEEAVDNAIGPIERQIFQYISPIGYITQRRELSAEHPSIFKVSFGSNDDVKPGDEVWVKTEVHELNEFTGKKEIHYDSQRIGIVSDQITANFSWIIVEDKQISNRLLIGQRVMAFS